MHEKQLAEKDALIAERDARIAELEKTIEEKDAQIREDALLEEKDDKLKAAATVQSAGEKKEEAATAVVPAVTSEFDEALLNAADKGDLAEVEALLAKGADAKAVRRIYTKDPAASMAVVDPAAREGGGQVWWVDPAAL